MVNEFITKEFDYKVREISDVNNLPIIIYNLSGNLLINTTDYFSENNEFNRPLSFYFWIMTIVPKPNRKKHRRRQKFLIRMLTTIGIKRW